MMTAILRASATLAFFITAPPATFIAQLFNAVQPWAYVVALFFTINPGQMDRSLPLDEANHLRTAYFRRLCT